MIDLIGADGTTPFTVALAMMLVLALLEGVGALIGYGLSNVIDSALPDFDVDLDIDAPDVSSPGPLSALFGWLCIGKVPFLVLLILLLTFFGLIGLFIQASAMATLGFVLPTWIAAFAALLASLPPVRWSALGIAKIMPRDETEAVEQSSFVGRVARITLGEARQGHPAESRLTDQFGQTHYVMVTPDVSDQTFPQGAEVLLVKHLGGSRYGVIANPHSSLSDAT